MLLLAFALAVSATPTPQPALTQLKTIVNLRSSPACSALRERVAPAIEHIMAGDVAIDASKPIFSSMYHDDVVLKSGGHMAFDVQHMENLITPIVSNMESAQAMIDQLQAGPIRQNLQAAVDKQRAALDVVNGLVTTYQLGDLQQGGLPDNWKNVFGSSAPAGSTKNGLSAPAATAPSADPVPPGASLLYGAGITRSPSDSRMPDENASTVTLDTDPYSGYAQAVVLARSGGDAAEAEASKAILAALERCRR